KRLATSDGTLVAQTLSHASCAMKIAVADGDEVAHRTYPMELDGGVAAGGFEVVHGFDLPGHAAPLADEALALLVAPPCPAGTTTVILDTPQLALQIHESCGHPTESDRAFGDEWSLAGAARVPRRGRGAVAPGPPALPRRHHHRHPRHAAIGTADPRVVRPPDRERSRVRRRVVAGGRVVPHARSPRPLSLRLGARQLERRRH